MAEIELDEPPPTLESVAPILPEISVRNRLRGLQLPSFRLPDSLAEGPYRRYWLAQMLATVAMWIQSTAANLVFLDLTSSAFKIGLINISSGVPMLFLSLAGGVVADRLNRRLIVMSTQTVIAALSLTWAVLVFTDSIAYWHVLVMAAIGGTVISFDLPAAQSLLAQLVRKDQLSEALALQSMSGNSTRIYAPLLGGVVIGVVGLTAAFLGHTVALLVFVATIFSLRRRIDRPRQATERRSPLSFMREGFMYVRQRESMIGLVITTGLISFLTIPIVLVLMPFYMTDVLGGGDAWVPISTSAFGVGSFSAALTMFRTGKREASAGLRMISALAGMVLGLLWLALAPNTFVALPGVALCGYCFEMSLLQVMTRLQQLAEDDVRGRVMSLNAVALNGAMPLATLTISSSISVLGMRPVAATCAVVLAVCVWWNWRRFAHLAFIPTYGKPG